MKLLKLPALCSAALLATFAYGAEDKLAQLPSGSAATEKAAAASEEKINLTISGMT